MVFMVKEFNPVKFFHNKHKKKHLICHCMKKHFPIRDFIEGEAPSKKAFSQHKYETQLFMLVLIGSAFLLLGIMSLAGLIEIGKGWWYWPAFGCFLAVAITFYRRNQALIDELEMNKRDVKRDIIDSRASKKFAEKSLTEPPETRDGSISFCPYCGGSIPELTVYCPYCGYKVQSP